MGLVAHNIGYNIIGNNIRTINIVNNICSNIIGLNFITNNIGTTKIKFNKMIITTTRAGVTGPYRPHGPYGP